MNPLTTKAIILQALIRGDAFGLEILERVEKLTEGEIKLNHGSLYPALRGLERDGFLKSYKGEPMPERGGRPRVYYKLTAMGSEAATRQRRVVGGLFGGLLGEGYGTV